MANMLRKYIQLVLNSSHQKTIMQQNGMKSLHCNENPSIGTKNDDARTSPDFSTNCLLNSLKNWRPSMLTGLWLVMIIVAVVVIVVAYDTGYYD